jgi:hypothetical protein
MLHHSAAANAGKNTAGTQFYPGKIIGNDIAPHQA